MDLIAKIIEAWGWVGIVPSRIVAENDFGNLIIEDADERFWRLCPEDPYCKIIAESEKELTELRSDPEFVVDWEMLTLVEAARKTLGELSDGRKLCLKIPGMLGGGYEIDNIATVPFDELISFSGELGIQCRDLPDGTEVMLQVVD